MYNQFLLHIVDHILHQKLMYSCHLSLIAMEMLYISSALQKLKKQELITLEGDRIALTDLGIDVSNQVFVEFIPEDFVRR